MKAPDKCYITREKNGVVYSISFNDNGGLEYIRKDALIEILKGYSHPLTRVVVQELVDKINKL